jgi:hypothetical protein
MSVCGDNASFSTFEDKRIEPGRVGRADPKTHELASPMFVDRVLFQVHGHHRAETSRTRRIQLEQLIVLPDTEIAQVQNRLTVEPWLVLFGDNNDTCQTTRDLLHCAAVGMVPVHPGVFGRIAVAPGLVLLDRELGEIGNAIHFVGYAHAVQVHGRRL